MKSYIALLFSCAALISTVLANFDLYMVDVTDNIFHTHTQAWQVFEAEPKSCDEVSSKPYWFSSGDVSGDKEGVRCVGSGCDYKPPADNIDVLEMNFNNDGPIYHWTLYKDRGRTMVGLDGNTYGNCIVFPNGDYSCSNHNGAENRHGYRKFRCLTRFTADDLNNSVGI